MNRQAGIHTTVSRSSQTKLSRDSAEYYGNHIKHLPQTGEIRQGLVCIRRGREGVGFVSGENNKHLKVDTIFGCLDTTNFDYYDLNYK